MPPEGLWVPLTIWAGFAQTLRNAAQRHLVADVGTLAATLVRFLFGLPFALVYLAAVLALGGERLPSVSAGFLAWVTEGGVAQIAATALLLQVMADRNFAVGVAFSKTELVQVTVFGAAFLGDPASPLTVTAVLLATLGVILLSPAPGAGGPLQGVVQGWTSRSALLGIASGAGFALAAVGYRGAALELDAGFTLAAAYSLVWAQAVQVLILGGWLLARNAGVILTLFRLWRPSVAAGFMGAAASVGWFTAFAIEPASHVRTLGLVELLFSLAAARRFFAESLSRAELAGVGFLTGALVLITLGT